MAYDELECDVNLRSPDAVSERQYQRAAPRRAPRPAGPPPRPRQWLRTLGIALLSLILVGAVGLFVGYRYAAGLIEGRGTQVAGTERPPPGEPTNILIVGSDSREGLTDRELRRLKTVDVGGRRTDTMIILHVSPRQQKAVMVSLPRDLKTQVDGRTDKINAAGVGGPDLLVRTVEETTGLNINHYVEVNFAGFVKVVDAVGGVRLCNRSGKQLVDRYAGLKMPPGCHELDGVRSLSYVRARHIGIDGDFGRITRQQEFLRAVMGRVGSGGNLVNIPKLLRIANSIAEVVQTDDGLTTRQALSLARRVGNLSADRVDMRVYPSSAPGPACAGCPDYVLPKPEAALLMKAIREDAARLPPVGHPGGAGDVSLAAVQLTVFNGGEVDGAARRAAAELEQIGIPAAVGGNAEQPAGDRSTLAYPRALAEQAQLLASLLGDQVKLVQARDGTAGRRLTLTVGRNYQGLRATGASRG